MQKILLFLCLAMPFVAHANCKSIGQKTLSLLASNASLKNILQVEHEFLANCQDARIVGAVEKAKTDYLASLGVMVKSFPPEEKDLLFRGLISADSDSAALKNRIKAVKPTNSAMTFLTSLYGGVGRVRDVLVIGATPKQQKALEEFLFEICPDEKECALWNRLTLYKVLIVAPPGLAGYIPDIGELVISGTLLDQPNELHKTVLLHELAHVAELWAVVRLGKVWGKEFCAFSNWTRGKDAKVSTKATRTPASRDDKLTKQSDGSSFSVLPDAIYEVPSGADGFVTARSYEESLKRNDFSEDFADHVAIFRYAPERFCWQGKEIAPRKFKWIAENIFPYKEAPKLSCATPAK